MNAIHFGGNFGASFPSRLGTSASVRLFATALAALLIVAASSARAAGTDTTTPEKRTASLDTGVAPSSDNSAFVLGPMDKLRIIFYGEEALNTQPEYTISSTGNVSLPLVGDVKAAGLTVSQFRAEIYKAYHGGYLADPRTSIEVITARPFYILGEVKSPGQYAYTPGLTVLNAVAIAGGFTYRAVTDEVTIRHANDPSQRDYPLKSDTPVAPGDTITISERWF